METVQSTRPHGHRKRVNRYLFVAVLAASMLLGVLPAKPALAAKREFNMTIEEVRIQVAPDLKYNVFAFDGQVPGPLIHVKQGDEVTVHVTNNTSLPHTIHWHGFYQTDNWRNDGVPGVTQPGPGIQPGDTYTYHWIAEKPGTMWYHCHVNVNEHAGLRGMWGPIVVDPEHPSELDKSVTKDVIMMLSSWESKYANEYGKGGNPTDAPDYFSMNAKSFPLTQPIRVKKGDVVRVRFIGAGESLHAIHSHGHDMLVAYKDGLQLKDPYPVDTVLVYPGSHNDVIMYMNNSGRFIMHDHMDPHSTNNGKYPGGAITIVEYTDSNPDDDWYVWHDKKYDPDFFYSESMKKGYGLFDHDAFKGEPLTRRHHHRGQ